MIPSSRRPTVAGIEAALRAGPDRVDPGRALVSARQAAARTGMVDVAVATVPSPVGDLLVATTDAGVVLVGWDVAVALERLAAEVSPRVVEVPARLDGARRQLDEYFEHRRRSFSVRIDWQLSRGFRRDVLHALATVPYGRVVTYGDLAALAGRERAARAVGSAMAANPVPIIVPCHRVVRADGTLGHYSGAGGVATKRRLLELEGAPVPPG